jgi:hypothetical protein
MPSEIEIVWRTDEPRSDIDRSRLRSIAGQWIRQRLPQARLLLAVQHPDRAHSLSGSYLRLHLLSGGRNCLVLVSADNEPDRIPPLLTCALLWQTLLARTVPLAMIPTIYLLMPFRQSAIVYHRCRFLNRAKTNTEIWEYHNSSFKGYIFKKPKPPAPPMEDRDFRWPILGPFRWSGVLARVIELAPDLVRRYPRFVDYDSLRLRGLEFARVMGEDRDRLSFGIGPQRTDLAEDNFCQLRALVEEILYYRRADSPFTHHRYYRMQAERWLECLILENVSHLFPELHAEAIYSQIPVYLATDPGRVDILGVDKDGTLVIMELKVVEDPELPLQAVDYWGRVVTHCRRGDFERRGYFSGISLSRRPPRIYLVAPVFGFHDSTEVLLEFLKSGLEVWKIGINEDWRSGVKVLHRTCQRCGDLHV